MSNVIDLGDERRKRVPMPDTAGIGITSQNGAVVLGVDAETAGVLLELEWTPDAARIVARRIFEAAAEAERTKE